MTSYLRLLGALFAVSLLASACGGSTATESTNATSDDAVPNTDMPNTDMPDDAMSEEAMSEEATSATDDNESHGDEHEAGEHESSHDGHGAKTLDVNPDAPTPGVEIGLSETDTPGTFNLVVSLTNFTITPDAVDGEPVDNEGHMHLLIDGEKVERFMTTEHQVVVPEGEHLVEVELNANNHAAYAIDGVAIRAGKTVTGHGQAEPASESDSGHSHGEAGSGIEDGLSMADATVSLTATLAGGNVSLDGDERIEASVGDVVMVTINSDVAEEAHLHGYDVLVDVTPGQAATLLFTADTAGKFEIEFEQSGTFIAELVVS